VSGPPVPDLEETARAKQAVRERVWPPRARTDGPLPGATGRIPNFAGRPGGRRPAGLAPSVAGGPRGQGQPQGFVIPRA
jgi:hypothetical protein